MGQIIGSAAKPKRCNANKLQLLGVLPAGEYVLVSSDNSMNAAGQGHFDCYVVGDNIKRANTLTRHHIAELPDYIEFEDLETEDTSIVIRNDADTENVVEVTNSGLNAKNVSINGTPAQKKLIAGSGVSIGSDERTISVDVPFDSGDAQDAGDVLKVQDDLGNDVVVIDEDKMMVKAITDLNGNPIAGGASLSGLVVDLPTSADGSGIQTGFAYIESTTGNVKIKL